MEKIKWFTLLVSLTTFSQAPGNGVTDVDGNQYNSVIIGTQEWMKENLNVSKYSDGTIIPQVTDSAQWANLTTGAWCYYNNDPANGAVYGKLYNWYAVAGIHDNDPNTPNKILAPTGYYIPTDDEWTNLITFLGGTDAAGGVMKSTTFHWNTPNLGATNSSNFTGLPGGYLQIPEGWFQMIGINGFWWSFSEQSIDYSWGRSIANYTTQSSRPQPNKKAGISVRCIRNSSLYNTTFESNKLKLFPNPVFSILNVKAEKNLINQPYSIIDGIGRVVLNGNLNELDNTTINVEQLTKGIYFLKISSNTGIKFIKE
jgi:uncharacterized protein (TIGR02145 family)